MIRNPVDFCLCLAMAVILRHKVPGLRNTAMCLMRAVFYVTFVSLFWISLKSCIPLGDVIVTTLTFIPAFFVLQSRVLLGEHIPRKWPAQFALCLIGALLINKPLAPNPTCPAWNML